jgi:hypothetical protein
LAPYKGKNPISQISKNKNIGRKGFFALFLNHYKCFQFIPLQRKARNIFTQKNVFSA